LSRHADRDDLARKSEFTFAAAEGRNALSKSPRRAKQNGAGKSRAVKNH
jgi:hypothetical protein